MHKQATESRKFPASIFEEPAWNQAVHILLMCSAVVWIGGLCPALVFSLVGSSVSGRPQLLVFFFYLLTYSSCQAHLSTIRDNFCKVPTETEGQHLSRILQGSSTILALLRLLPSLLGDGNYWTNPDHNLYVTLIKYLLINIKNETHPITYMNKVYSSGVKIQLQG